MTVGVPRFVQVLIDGVTYLAAPHDPVVDLVEVAPDAEATPALAREAVEGALAALGGVEARLRAGFAAARLLDVSPGGEGAWRGPAHLFSFEARVAGTFEVTYAGEDPSDWPAPSSADGGGNSASSDASSA